MQNWTDSATVTVGQSLTVEIGLTCTGDCVVQVNSDNPVCSVALSVSDVGTSVQIENNDAIQAIEVVKVMDAQENYAVRVSMSVYESGQATVNCFVVSGEASILQARLALD